MAMTSVEETLMVLVAVCIAALVPGALSLASGSNVPGIMPFEPVNRAEIRNCLSVITRVPGCVSEIYASVFTDKVGIISSTCCNAISKVRRTNCWPKIFPPSPSPPLIPQVSRNSCPELGEILISNSMVDLPGLLPPKRDSESAKCWSHLTGVEGCVLDVYKAVVSGHFGRIGGSCCKAIGEIQDSCWPIMFPLETSFPPLLKSSCASVPEPSDLSLHQLP